MNRWRGKREQPLTMVVVLPEPARASSKIEEVPSFSSSKKAVCSGDQEMGLDIRDRCELEIDGFYFVNKSPRFDNLFLGHFRKSVSQRIYCKSKAEDDGLDFELVECDCLCLGFS